MKRITEEYGSPCNLMECTNAEFDMLREMFLAEGVELRITKRQGNICTVQIRNTYKDVAQSYPYRIMTGSAVCKIAEKAIADGNWRL